VEVAGIGVGSGTTMPPFAAMLKTYDTVPSESVTAVAVELEFVTIKLTMSVYTPVAPAEINVTALELELVNTAVPTRFRTVFRTTACRPALSAIAPTRFPAVAAVGYAVVAIKPS
jgi:hypothetical protein